MEGLPCGLLEGSGRHAQEAGDAQHLVTETFGASQCHSEDLARVPGKTENWDSQIPAQGNT